ncbi:MAG: allophanate hydrolase, partial [Mycobacterium sp.]
AHLRGQPLTWQLDDRGARWCGPAATAPRYRLARLATDPPKPGLVRVGPDTGTTIAGELWLISTAMLGDFLAELPDPMALGRVTLADGSDVVGFGCALDAWHDGADITHHGDWRSYRRRVGPGIPATRPDVVNRRWRRRALVVPGTTVDTTTDVEWLQAARIYVDLRVPAGLAPVTATSPAELTREDLLSMCQIQAFAGTLAVDGVEWTWHRDVDLHPAEPLPDRGRLHLADGLLIETGLGRDYFEDWLPTPTDPASTSLELALRDDSGRDGFLIRVGDRFGYARGRAAGDQPDGDRSLYQSIATAGLDRGRALMDLEISLGTVAGAVWRITSSTLPFRIGDDLSPEIVAGQSVSTAERGHDGTPLRRRWTVRSTVTATTGKDVPR